MTPIVLSGALDHYSAESLKQQLLAAIPGLEPSGQEALTLDMRGVEHIDACGLQVLIACGKGLNKRKLYLLGAEPSILEWIRLAGADGLFEPTDSKC